MINLKTSSAKAKGRRCARQARDLLLKYSRASVKLEDNLTEDDLRITPSGVNDEDIQMSPAARRVWPFNIECKNVEKLNVPKAFEQAKSHGNHMPLLVHTKNRGELLCTMRFEELLALLIK